MRHRGGHMSGTCPSFPGLGCQESATLVPEWPSFITRLNRLSESSPNYARSLWVGVRGEVGREHK